MASLILNTQSDTLLKVRYHSTQDILIYWRKLLGQYPSDLQVYLVLFWKHSPLTS